MGITCVHYQNKRKETAFTKARSRYPKCLPRELSSLPEAPLPTPDQREPQPRRTGARPSPNQTSRLRGWRLRQTSLAAAWPCVHRSSPARHLHQELRSPRARPSRRTLRRCLSCANKESKKEENISWVGACDVLAVKAIFLFLLAERHPSVLVFPARARKQWLIAPRESDPIGGFRAPRVRTTAKVRGETLFSGDVRAFKPTSSRPCGVFKDEKFREPICPRKMVPR